MQDPSADSARYEEVTDEKSADGLLLVILIFVFGLMPIADDADDSGLKGFVESSLNLLHFVLSDQLPTLLLREFLVVPGFVDLLHLDDPAHRGIDRDDQLLDLLLKPRFET